MEWFDPRRPDAFQHAGTFNNNVLTMNAGLVGLTEVYTPERARALNAFGDGLRERLNAVVRRRGLAMQFTGIGSMIGVHMTEGPIRSEDDAERGNGALRDLFYFDSWRAASGLPKRGHDGAVDRARRGRRRQAGRRSRGIRRDPHAIVRSSELRFSQLRWNQ